MITETVTIVIQCDGQTEYLAEKARIERMPNLQVQPEFHDGLLKITLDVTVER